MTPLEKYNNNIQTAGFSPDPSQLHAVEMLTTLQGQLLAAATEPFSLFKLFRPRRQTIPGVYLVGSVGRGKTYVMDLFYECLDGVKKSRVHYHRLMLDVHEQLRMLPKSPDPLIIIGKQIAEETVVLCIDEFHVTDVADAMLLSGLLHTLFKNGVTLVATSNTAIDDLYLNGLQRERFMQAIELLNINTRQIELYNGQDYRLAHLEKGQTYFLGPHATTQQQIANKMNELAPTTIQYNKSVSIHHREIQTLAMADDVVWFDFDELCDTPRAAKDYLEIAKLFHTVLLSDIPELTAARDNAAKRFMHLIDALYDHRVKLIVASEHKPEQLYRGVLLTDMFERTVSRLVEMESHDYLALPHRP